MLIMALAEDIKTILNSFNESRDFGTERNELIVMEKIYEMLEFHSTAKKLRQLITTIPFVPFKSIQ